MFRGWLIWRMAKGWLRLVHHQSWPQTACTCLLESFSKLSLIKSVLIQLQKVHRASALQQSLLECSMQLSHTIHWVTPFITGIISWSRAEQPRPNTLEIEVRTKWRTEPCRFVCERATFSSELYTLMGSIRKQKWNGRKYLQLGCMRSNSEIQWSEFQSPTFKFLIAAMHHNKLKPYEGDNVPRWAQGMKATLALQMITIKRVVRLVS